jgi:acyl-CoA reductase-like NAD-dependent aldehyde dehydrogenase
MTQDRIDALRAAPAARKKILLKWADLIASNALEIAVPGVRENGTGRERDCGRNFFAA